MGLEWGNQRGMKTLPRPSYDNLLHSLYGPLTERDWAADFLEQLCRATRSRSAALVATNVLARKDTLPAWFGAEAATAAAYEKTFGSQNPWRDPSGSRAQTAGVVLLSDDAVSLPELKRTPFWLDFLKPMDIAHGTGLIGLRTNKEVASLTLLRSERTGIYSGRELSLLRAVAPHWAHACAVRSRLGLLTEAERGLHDVLDRLSLGVYLLDASGRVLRTNAAGDALLREGSLVAQRRDRPTAVHGVSAAALARALDAAIAVPGKGPLPASPVSLRDAQGQVRAHAAAHPVSGGPDGARAVLFVQTIEGSEPSARALRRALREVFGLTEREAELAQRLDTGDDLAQAAAGMGVSLEGARTRLKSAFGKTGTRGQADLARFLGALRSVMGNR